MQKILIQNRSIALVAILILFPILKPLVRGAAPVALQRSDPQIMLQTDASKASPLFLPLVAAASTVTPPWPPSTVPGPIINIPFVDGAVDFSDTTIFWFGKVTPTENYVDVRIAYTQNELYLYIAVFDRRLWYDETPSANQLTDWDAVSLFLDLNPQTPSAPGPQSFLFIAQFTPFPEWESRSSYQQAYMGNGSGWSPASLPFKTISGWRGNAWNDNIDDRGWAMTYRIPFSSLGLSAPPPRGASWRLGMMLHDRDDAGGAPIPQQSWPPALQMNTPTTFGYARFGIPGYAPPATTSQSTLTIREGLNGAIVPDAAVGGTTGNLCNAEGDFWNHWGNANFAEAADFNIQNQADIADWPCFAKYYVTFPIDQIPPGSVIISAKLILHQWGNSGSLELAKPSVVHVSSVGADWKESSLTWNNAPIAFENISYIVVPVVDCSGVGWPCFPRQWDVSRAVAAAHRAGEPVRLALYSTDSDYHSGKFFTTSETGDWNEIGRPTLVITWGAP